MTESQQLDTQFVYNKIAQDFSKTRYKVWQSVARFIGSLPESSYIADIGCGNGKNMFDPRHQYIGMDLSEEMVQICQNRGLDAIVGDIRNIPLKDNSVTAAMSVAVIHHLDTRSDRIHAISELARITQSGGRVFICVWAFNQPDESKRKFTQHDELVPFHNRNGEVFYRYYHLYSDGELDSEIREVPQLCIIESYMEKGNYVCIAERK